MLFEDMLQSPETKENLLKKISLQRFGKVEDVAEAALFLARSQYMHGQVVNKLLSSLLLMHCGIFLVTMVLAKVLMIDGGLVL